MWSTDGGVPVNDKCSAPDCLNYAGTDGICSVHYALAIAIDDRSRATAVLGQVHKYLQACINGRSDVDNRGLARALVYEPEEET
jgi:hypothetical protein